jgi:predicted nucleic acid-binding protein
VRILIDTSVLVRTSHPQSADYQIAVDAIAALPDTGYEACLVPQVIYEYWVVATRPSRQNGLGFTAQQAASDIAQLRSFFPLLRDERAIFDRWHQLVTDHEVLGKNGHDARLVAAMERHAILQILTFNDSDFLRFPGITVLTPRNIVTRSPNNTKSDT